MENLGEVLIIIAIVVLAVALIVYANVQARKRREALAAWAHAQGLIFSAEHQYTFDARFGFSYLHQGANRYAYNVSTGRRGAHEVYAFDYHYETYSMDSKGRRQTHTHVFSAVIVTPSFPIKPLLIRKEGFFDKVGEFVGMDDIDFELAEFSREFFVKSSDRRWAFDVLHQESMEFLMQSPRFTIEFQDRSAIAVASGSWGAERFETALNVVTGLIDRIPQGVVRDLKGS